MSQTNLTGPILTNSTYKTAKGLCLVGFPFVSSTYFALSQFWDMPGTEGVLGTLAILSFLLGTSLRGSSARYYASSAAYDGEMVLVADGGGVRTFSLEVNGDPDELAMKSVISFKVRKTSVPEPPNY